jgi:hypothetical protein
MRLKDLSESTAIPANEFLSRLRSNEDVDRFIGSIAAEYESAKCAQGALSIVVAETAERKLLENIDVTTHETSSPPVAHDRGSADRDVWSAKMIDGRLQQVRISVRRGDSPLLESAETSLRNAELELTRVVSQRLLSFVSVELK